MNMRRLNAIFLRQLLLISSKFWNSKTLHLISRLLLTDSIETGYRLRWIKSNMTSNNTHFFVWSDVLSNFWATLNLQLQANKNLKKIKKPTSYCFPQLEVVKAVPWPTFLAWERTKTVSRDLSAIFTVGFGSNITECQIICAFEL